MITTHFKMKTDTHLTEEFDRLVERSMHDWHVPGLAIAVIREKTVDAKVGACVSCTILLTE